MLAGVADLLGTSWVPSLSCNDIALATPRQGVLSAGLVGVGCLALVIMPEGVVEPVVGTGLVRALLEAGVGAGLGFGEDASNGRRSNKEVGKGNHFVGFVRSKSSWWSARSLYRRSQVKVPYLYTLLRTGSG
jgi:hypothetical protein